MPFDRVAEARRREVQQGEVVLAREVLHVLGHRLEAAVDRVLAAGFRTRDIAAGGPAIGTVEMGTKVVEALAG